MVDGGGGAAVEAEEAEEAEEDEEDEEEVEGVEEVGYLCTLDAEAGRLLEVVVPPLALPPLARRAGTADLGRCAVLVAPPSGPLV